MRREEIESPEVLSIERRKYDVNIVNEYRNFVRRGNSDKPTKPMFFEYYYFLFFSLFLFHSFILLFLLRFLRIPFQLASHVNM